MIDAEKATYPVTRMVDLLGVSRSGYYAWAGRLDADPGPRAARLADLTVKIKVAHDASDGVNGAPRILADLREAGEVVSRKTVAKLMRDNEIRGISPRPWQPVTTIPGANPHTIPDLVERRFDRGALNVVWTSDITYLATGEGWLYLCAVRDGCSRRVLGYAFSESLHTDVVETALRRRSPSEAPMRAAPRASSSTPIAAASTPPPNSPTLPTTSACSCPLGAPGCAGTTPSRKASGPP